jgi:hypothetical protein
MWFITFRGIPGPPLKPLTFLRAALTNELVQPAGPAFQPASRSRAEFLIYIFFNTLHRLPALTRPSSFVARQLHSFFASLVIKTTDIKTTKAVAHQPAIAAGPGFSSPFLEEVL